MLEGDPQPFADLGYPSLVVLEQELGEPQIRAGAADDLVVPDLLPDLQRPLDPRKGQAGLGRTEVDDCLDVAASSPAAATAAGRRGAPTPRRRSRRRDCCRRSCSRTRRGQEARPRPRGCARPHGAERALGPRPRSRSRGRRRPRTPRRACPAAGSGRRHRAALRTASRGRTGSAASRCDPRLAAESPAATANSRIAGPSPAISACSASRAKGRGDIGSARSRSSTCQCSAPRRPGVMPDRTDCRTSSCRKVYAGASKRSIPAVTHSSTESGDDVGHAMDEVGLDARADHRGGLQREPPLRRQSMHPREDGVLHGRRQVLAARRHHLGHEERVAAGLAEQGIGIDARLGRELRHGCR